LEHSLYRIAVATEFAGEQRPTVMIKNASAAAGEVMVAPVLVEALLLLGAVHFFGLQFSFFLRERITPA